MLELAYQGRVLKRRLSPWSRKDSLDRLYEVVNDFLRDLDVEYWIAWGTLLGFHREGRILEHDQDVDFGALAEDYQRIREAADRLPDGFTLYDTSHLHGGPKLYIDYRNWTADIYFYRREGGTLHLHLDSPYPPDSKPVPVEQLLPTTEVTFMGRSTRVPARAEEHLRHYYGYIGPDARRDPDTGYFVPSTAPVR
jgi:phosphorylcholine metabolism protein LicD